MLKRFARSQTPFAGASLSTTGARSVACGSPIVKNRTSEYGPGGRIVGTFGPISNSSCRTVEASANATVVGRYSYSWCPVRTKILQTVKSDATYGASAAGLTAPATPPRNWAWVGAAKFVWYTTAFTDC